MKYTNIEIAEDFGLWAEYVDPMGVMTYDEFNNMSVKERLSIVERLED